MRSMQWQLGMLGTISAFAYRHRETKRNLCRDGRSQDLPSTDFQPAVRHIKYKKKNNNTHTVQQIHTRQLQQYTRPTNNKYTHKTTNNNYTHRHISSGYGFCIYRVMFLCVGPYFHKQWVLVVYTFDYFVFIDFILHFIRSGIVTCRRVLNLSILSLLV